MCSVKNCILFVVISVILPIYHFLVVMLCCGGLIRLFASLPLFFFYPSMLALHSRQMWVIMIF